MERKRHSGCQNEKIREMPETGKDDTIIWRHFGTGIPADIFIDIVVRLPVRSILTCRCVCKTWRQRILDPEFAESHFKRAQQSIILQITDPEHFSRTLHLLEPQSHSFDDTCHDEFCSEEHIGMNLETKLKIPLRDHKLTLGGRLVSKPLTMANSKGSYKGKRLIATQSEEDRYWILNSCNGLLCLSQREGNDPVALNDPVAVCNPVTGEYTQLMSSIKSHFRVLMRIKSLPIIGGLGFSPSTDQYKVVRIYKKYHHTVAEVETLGSGSWKEIAIGYTPEYFNDLQSEYPTYMSGKLHWLSVGGVYADEIFFFNLENEHFGSVALPSCDPKRIWRRNSTTMGVLHNQISICHVCYYPLLLLIWLMNDNDATSPWELVLSIDIEEKWPFYGLYYPMKIYENGAVLIFHNNSGLIYHDPKKSGFKYFRMHGSFPNFKVISYVPSFISLEKQIIGDGVVLQTDIRRSKMIGDQRNAGVNA